MNKNKLLLILFVLGIGSITNAQQFELRYLGATNTTTFYSSNQMLSLMIRSNSSENYNVFLEFTVEEISVGLAANLRTNVFPMPAKSTRTGPAFPGIRGRLLNLYSNSAFDQITNPSFNYPPGKYTICAFLKDEEGGILAKVCFQLAIKSFQSLHLIYPFDEQDVEEKLPIFSWTPISNTNSKVSYRIRWVESNGDIPKSEFEERIAFFLQENIRATFLPYSNQFNSFDTTKEYLWKVQAYSNNTLLAESETWIFKFKSPQLKAPAEQPYIRIDAKSQNSIYYLHGNDLNIEIMNPHSKIDATYSISSLDNIEVETGTWKGGDNFKHGKNQISISVGNKINKGTPHRLVVILPNQTLELFFIKV